jgi:hypothetical protein
MIINYWKHIAAICTLIPIVIILCSLYAYHANEKRAPDDPEKKIFSPYSIWLVPFTVPLLIVVNLIFLILTSLAFGFFLVLFPFALLLLRKPFLIQWILKHALNIGNKVLKVNTELLRVVGFYPAARIKLQYE